MRRFQAPHVDPLHLVAPAVQTLGGGPQSVSGARQWRMTRLLNDMFGSLRHSVLSVTMQPKQQHGCMRCYTLRIAEETRASLYTSALEVTSTGLRVDQA